MSCKLVGRVLGGTGGVCDGVALRAGFSIVCGVVWGLWVDLGSIVSNGKENDMGFIFWGW